MMWNLNINIHYLLLTLRQSFFFVMLTISTALYAAPKPSMSAIDILNVSQLEESAISPNAKQLAFIKSDANWALNKVVQNIWLTDLGAEKPRQLTFDNSSKTRINWSPNGKFLSFVSQRMGLSKSSTFKGIYLLPLEGGEAQELTSHRADIRSYQWSNDGKSIYFLASMLLDPDIAIAKTEKNDIFAFEETQSYQHIWKVNLSNRFTRQVTHGNFHVLDFTLSKDSKRIAFNRASGDLPDDWHQSEVWISDEFGGNQHQLTNNNYAEKNLAFSPDSQSLLFISDVNAEGRPYHDANLFVLSIASNAITLLAGDQLFEVENAYWNKDGKDIFILANMGVHSEIWRIPFVLQDKKNKAIQLTNGKHTIKYWRYDALANRHAFVLVSADNPGEFATLSPKSQKILKFTQLHKHFRKEFRLPEQKLIRWRASDDTYIEGLLSYPLNYKEGRSYPLVVHAHGGPASSDQYGQFYWSTYIPLVSAQNYFYFSVNYRGSRGYGDEFMRDTVGQYFNKNHTDILSGIDHLVSLGLVDTKKVIMSGWSAGGHMTNKLISFTNRFIAASSGAGAIEWQSMFGESDVRYERRQWFNGTPWQKNADTNQFLADSPIKDLWKVQTPTIIFVGENDVRVPPSQSKILYRALRDLEVDTKLYIAPRESHSFQELRHRLFKINAELDWFNRHVGKEAFKWAEAPRK